MHLHQRELEALADLSRQFGTEEYVKGGGGNTSFKDTYTLWVKPSGRTLLEMTPDAFVAMDRSRLSRIYEAAMPEEPQARETLVKEMMSAAVRAGSTGRPSVEAALHDSFAARFVVHVHPPLVNGMTCARDGERTCRQLFPDALWIPYLDPGYTLCMGCRRAIRSHIEKRGTEPSAVFLQNHGIIVAGDTPALVRATLEKIMTTLRHHYDAAGIEPTLRQGPAPTPDVERRVTGQVRAAFGDNSVEVAGAGACTVPDGPITPDHVCFSGAYPLKGEPTARAISEYRERHGRDPMVVSCEEGVFGIGRSRKSAALALVFALDGAFVRQLAEAFGGLRYMDARAREFIENWEVEAYRRRIATSSAPGASGS